MMTKMMLRYMTVVDAATGRTPWSTVTTCRGTVRDRNTRNIPLLMTVTVNCYGNAEIGVSVKTDTDDYGPEGATQTTTQNCGG